jgi:hypothetical protein
MHKNFFQKKYLLRQSFKKIDCKKLKKKEKAKFVKKRLGKKICELILTRGKGNIIFIKNSQISKNSNLVILLC